MRQHEVSFIPWSGRYEVIKEQKYLNGIMSSWPPTLNKQRIVVKHWQLQSSPQTRPLESYHTNWSPLAALTLGGRLYVGLHSSSV